MVRPRKSKLVELAVCILLFFDIIKAKITYSRGIGPEPPSPPRELNQNTQKYI